MSFSGSGTFLINTAGQPVVSGTVISSTAFNALTADLATGLSTCITKDGQTTVTANIPMATYKFTGLGAGSAAADSANLSQVQSTVVKLLASVSGTDTITAVGSPTVAAYAAGQMFYFVAAGDNTGAVTLNIDSLGAKAVTRDGSVALAASDIKSGEVVVVVYDGTRFQMINAANSFGNTTINGTLSVTGATNLATSSGNVGIGTSSPAVSLDVAATGGMARIGGASGNNLLQAYTGSVGGGFWAGGQTRFYTTGAMTFSVGATLTTASPTGYTDAMTLDASGNLGIGTTSPSGKLSVVETAGGSPAIRIQGDSSTNVGRLSFTDNGVTRTNALLTADNSGNLAFATNGITERARITSGGAFCVGTTASTGSETNTAAVTGGVFSTFNATPSIAHNTATTVATLGSGDAMYLVSTALSLSGSPTSYNALALVRVSQSTASVSTIVSATAMTVSVSGLNVQLTQTQGATQTCPVAIIRLL